MASFSASDAAFAGFGFVQRKPGAIIIWAIAQLVVSVGLFAVIASQFAPIFAHFATLQQSAAADPKQAAELFRQIMPFYGDMLLFTLVFYPVLFATMNRAVLKPKDSAFGYIRLGGDELRQLGLLLSFVVLGIGAEIVVIILTIIVGVIVGMVAHAASGSDGLTFLSLVAVGVGVMCACVYIGVRLSLSSAQTFATGKLNIFGSWELTRGRFWPMFGAYLVAGILCIIVTLLGYVIIVALSVAVGGGQQYLDLFAHSGSTVAPPMPTLASLATVPVIIQLILGAALTAMTWPVLMMPAPTIYREIVADARGASDVS